MIVLISRESGCGGHEIAYRLANKLGVAFYDKKIISEIARERGLNTNSIDFNSEILNTDNRKLKDLINTSNADRQAIQDLVRELAKKDCVIVGRLGSFLLKDGRDDLTSFYIHAEEDIKVTRIMSRHSVSIETARKGMNRINRERKFYLEKVLGKSWNNASRYNFSIDSGYLGLNGSVDLMEHILKNRLIVSKCFD